MNYKKSIEINHKLNSMSLYTTSLYNASFDLPINLLNSLLFFSNQVLICSGFSPRLHSKTEPTNVGSALFGGGGIRTRGEVAPTQTFQVCTLNHSDTSPLILLSLGLARADSCAISQSEIPITSFPIPTSAACGTTLFY